MKLLFLVGVIPILLVPLVFGLLLLTLNCVFQYGVKVSYGKLCMSLHARRTNLVSF